MERIIGGVCAGTGCDLAEFHGEAEHVHLLVNFPPTCLAAFTTSLKAGALAATPVALWACNQGQGLSGVR
jgi:Transposase IS200 like